MNKLKSNRKPQKKQFDVYAHIKDSVGAADWNEMFQVATWAKEGSIENIMDSVATILNYSGQLSTLFMKNVYYYSVNKDKNRGKINALYKDMKQLVVYMIAELICMYEYLSDDKKNKNSNSLEEMPDEVALANFYTILDEIRRIDDSTIIVSNYNSMLKKKNDFHSFNVIERYLYFICRYTGVRNLNDLELVLYE